MCTYTQTQAPFSPHPHRATCGFQAWEPAPAFPQRAQKSQKPEERVSRCVGIQVQLWGKGFPGSHGAPPGPQAARSPGQQAQPHAEGRQHGHSPGQQGHHGGCGENTGV